MSSSDSDTDPALPHFESVVTTALVEPDRSRASSVSLTKCKKKSSNSKSRRILADLDVIEVLSDHNNNQVNSISRDLSKVSYESFKKQLSINQGNTTEELLHPLTSSRVEPAVRKPPQKNKSAFKRNPKPAKRIQYNIKKFNLIESSSDDSDDIYNKILKNNPRSIKRGGPITNKNQNFKKSKAKENSSVQVPEVKSKRPFVVEDIIGYAKNSKQDEEFWSLWSSSCLTNNASVAEKSTKLKQTFVPENLIKHAGNKQDDDFWSLSSLENSLELDSNLKVIDESKTFKDKICVTSKPDVEEGVKPRSDCNHKTDEDIHSESKTFKDKICVPLNPDLEDGEKPRSDCNHKTDEEVHSVQDVVDLNGSPVDEFTEASCTKFMVVSQDESFSPGGNLELLTEGKLEKGGKDIFGWIATGRQEYQQDEIFKQVECQLKEFSKFIQLKLDMIDGPIAEENYKFYNFLLDLEDKLNTDFRRNSDIDEQDFM